MAAYDTLSEALHDLQQRGFTYDFNLLEDCIECRSLSQTFGPQAFHVIEVHRFEGMSSAGDNAVLYVIRTDSGLQGTLVDAYGAYADSLSPEMIKKMKVEY